MSLWIFAFAFLVHAAPSRVGVCHALLDGEAATLITSTQILPLLAQRFKPRLLEWVQMNARLKETSREIQLRVFVGDGRQADQTSLQALTRAMFTQNLTARELRGDTAIRRELERLNQADVSVTSAHLSRSAKMTLGLIPPLVTLALLGNQHFNPVWTYDGAVEVSFAALFALSMGGGYVHYRDHRFATELEAIQSYLNHPELNQTKIVYSSLRVPKDRGVLKRLVSRGFIEHLGEVTFDLLRRQTRPVVYFWQMFYFDEQTGEPVWWLGVPKI